MKILKNKLIGTLIIIFAGIMGLLIIYFMPSNDQSEIIVDGQYGYKIELMDGNNKITDTWFSRSYPRFTASRAGCTRFTDFRTNQEKTLCNGTFLISEVFLKGRE